MPISSLCHLATVRILILLIVSVHVSHSGCLDSGFLLAKSNSSHQPARNVSVLWEQVSCPPKPSLCLRHHITSTPRLSPSVSKRLYGRTLSASQLSLSSSISSGVGSPTPFPSSTRNIRTQSHLKSTRQQLRYLATRCACHASIVTSQSRNAVESSICAHSHARRSAYFSSLTQCCYSRPLCRWS